MNYISVLKALFKEPPTLEDYIAAHQPIDIVQLEYLEKQYTRISQNKNFWGSIQ